MDFKRAFLFPFSNIWQFPDYQFDELIFRATRILDWTIVDDPLYSVQSSNLPFDKTIRSLGERTFTFPKGVFSYTGMSLHLSRNTHKYWGSYFIPLSLFVVISWLSFLINVEQVPGRMGLLITLYLILVNTYSSTMAVSPPVGGFGPMGFFMIGCQGTIFLAMLEYGYLLYRYSIYYSLKAIIVSLFFPIHPTFLIPPNITSLSLARSGLLTWKCQFSYDH